MNMNTPIPEAKIDVAQVAVQSRGYWATVLERLKRDRVTLFFGGVVLLVILLTVNAVTIFFRDRSERRRRS